MAAAALMGFFATGCTVERPISTGDLKGEEECGSRYALEVANDASDRVRVRIRMRNQWIEGARSSDIIALESGERRTFRVSAIFTGCDDDEAKNTLVSSFREIHYHDHESDDPYKSYLYEIGRCEDFTSPCVNDDRYIHLSSNGSWERLFVESPDRPFYLQRDQDDPDLARIVITFVPRPDSGSESGGGAE